MSECGKGSTGRKASDIGEAGTAGKKKCWLVHAHKATRRETPQTWRYQARRVSGYLK